MHYQLNRAEVRLVAAAAVSRALLSVLQPLYGPVFQSGTPWLSTLAMWRDFYGVYLNQLNHMAQGALPYRDFGYSYPPLFLYVLLPFFLLGGAYAAALPILVADTATSPLIYLVVRRFSTEKVAFFAGMAYALSPFFLVYEGYSWLSSQPMFFFLLLSVYLLRTGKPLPSAVALGVAALFKQEAIFILPVYAVWLVKNHRAQAWKALVLFTGVLFVVSVPFLALAPQQYIGQVSFGALAVPSASPYGVGAPLAGFGASPLLISQCPAPSAVPVSNSSCTSSYVTYPNPLLTVTINVLESVSYFVRIPLFILLGVALYASRGRDNFFELACAYSLTGFVILFSVLFHPAYAYYMVPVYGLLIASSRRLSTLTIAFAAPLLGLITAVGYFQEVLPLAATLGIVFAQELSRDDLAMKKGGAERGGGGMDGPTSEPPRNPETEGPETTRNISRHFLYAGALIFVLFRGVCGLHDAWSRETERCSPFEPLWLAGSGGLQLDEKAQILK